MEISQWDNYYQSGQEPEPSKHYPECDEVLSNGSQYYDSHYAGMDVQPIELMQDVLTPEEFRGYLKGSIIKYRMRAGHKAGEKFDKDMAKKERYREWLLQAIAGLRIDPRV